MDLQNKDVQTSGGLFQSFSDFAPQSDEDLFLGLRIRKGRCTIIHFEEQKLFVETLKPFIVIKTSTLYSQWCKSLLSIGGDNLQFYPKFCPIFNIGGNEPRPRLFSGEQIK